MSAKIVTQIDNTWVTPKARYGVVIYLDLEFGFETVRRAIPELQPPHIVLPSHCHTTPNHHFLIE